MAERVRLVKSCDRGECPSYSVDSEVMSATCRWAGRSGPFNGPPLNTSFSSDHDSRPPDWCPLRAGERRVRTTHAGSTTVDVTRLAESVAPCDAQAARSRRRAKQNPAPTPHWPPRRSKVNTGPGA